MDITVRNHNDAEIAVMFSTTPFPENTRPSQIIDPKDEDEVYIRQKTAGTNHPLLAV